MDQGGKGSFPCPFISRISILFALCEKTSHNCVVISLRSRSVRHIVGALKDVLPG